MTKATSEMTVQASSLFGTKGNFTIKLVFDTQELLHARQFHKVVKALSFKIEQIDGGRVFTPQSLCGFVPYRGDNETIHIEDMFFSLTGLDKPDAAQGVSATVHYGIDDVKLESFGVLIDDFPTVMLIDKQKLKSISEHALTAFLASISGYTSSIDIAPSELESMQKQTNEWALQFLKSNQLLNGVELSPSLIK